MVLGAVRRRFAADVQSLAKELGLTAAEALQATRQLESEGRLRRLGEVLVDLEELDRRLAAGDERMRRRQAEDPLWRGLDRAQWRREVMPEIAVRDAALLAAELAAQGALRLAGERVLPAGSEVPLPQDVRSMLEGLAAFVAAGDLQPQPPSEWPEAKGLGPQRLQDLIAYLVDTGALVRTGDVLFSSEAVQGAERRVRELLAGGREATTAELREALGMTRKYAVPLLEHFDEVRLTRRFGDVRRLIGAGEVGGGGH